MKITIIGLFFSLFSSLLLAQSGAISGKIISGGTPMAFANIALMETPFGSTTGEQGSFAIQNIPVGTYQLVISALGYQTIRQNGSGDRKTNK